MINKPRLHGLTLALGFCAALMTAGCSSVSEHESLTVHLTPEASTVLPTLALTDKVAAQQLLTISYQEESHQIIAMLQGQHDSLQLTILSPSGIRLYDAVYAGGNLSVHSFINIDKLPPAAQVLFDIMLCILPKDAIAAVLPGGFAVTDAGTERILSDKGTKVYTISFAENGDSGTVGAETDDLSTHEVKSILHHVFNYQITFQNL